MKVWIMTDHKGISPRILQLRYRSMRGLLLQRRLVVKWAPTESLVKSKEAIEEHLLEQ